MKQANFFAQSDRNEGRRTVTNGGGTRSKLPITSPTPNFKKAMALWIFFLWLSTKLEELEY